MVQKIPLVRAIRLYLRRRARQHAAVFGERPRRFRITKRFVAEIIAKVDAFHDQLMTLVAAGAEGGEATPQLVRTAGIAL